MKNQINLLSNRIEIIDLSGEMKIYDLSIVRFYNTDGFDMNMLSRKFYAEKYEIIMFSSEIEKVLQTDSKIVIEELNPRYFSVTLYDQFLL